MRNSQEARRPEVRPLLRSLLQKTVRRGDAQLAEIVACRLAERGDSAWLKTRAGVIAFEECWPYGAKLLNRQPLVILREMASLTKNKEAAGLGSLAHALAEGDRSVLDAAPDPVAVKIVAASLTRTEEFFLWASRSCHDGERADLLRIARTYFQRASWPWDKAFASAAAYFACLGHPLTIEQSPPDAVTMSHFPLWVAVDRHTPSGKAALRRVASQLWIPSSQLEWSSFYLESASCNERAIGEWWEAEMGWRLRTVHLDMSEAQALWGTARDHVRKEVAKSVEILEAALQMPGG
nr:hypothetical protein [Delftia sp. PE138]